MKTPLVIEKKKIKEVHDYFRDKLVTGDFEVKEIKTHTISLIIDKEYFFRIWTSSEDFAIGTYATGTDALNNNNFMSITFRVKDKKALWSKLKPIIKKYNDTVVLAEKKETFEQLKKELEL